MWAFVGIGIAALRCAAAAPLPSCTQAKWRANGPLKLGPGLYVSHVDADGGLYVVNGPPPTPCRVPVERRLRCHEWLASAHCAAISDRSGTVWPQCACLRGLRVSPQCAAVKARRGWLRCDSALFTLQRSLSGFYMAMREKFTTAGAQAPPLPSLLGQNVTRWRATRWRATRWRATPRWKGVGRWCRYTAWRLSLAAMPQRGRTSEKRCACGGDAVRHQPAQTGSAARWRTAPPLRGSSECAERGATARPCQLADERRLPRE